MSVTKITAIHVSVAPGVMLQPVIDDCLLLAVKERSNVMFDYNGKRMTVCYKNIVDCVENSAETVE